MYLIKIMKCQGRLQSYVRHGFFNVLPKLYSKVPHGIYRVTLINNLVFYFNLINGVIIRSRKFTSQFICNVRQPKIFLKVGTHFPLIELSQEMDFPVNARIRRVNTVKALSETNQGFGNYAMKKPFNSIPFHLFSFLGFKSQLVKRTLGPQTGRQQAKERQ